ncbi:MAG: ornithine cyclodeaminase [Hyphomicrobiaceae bacterium]
MLRIDEPTVDRVMSWDRLVQRMIDGHRLQKPEAGDILVRLGTNAIFVRTAGIEGLGFAVKAVTVFPDNPPPVPSIQGEVLLFDREQGQIIASINAAAETRWKTAGDSALGSKLLSREDSRSLLMIGAGTMSEPLIRAHMAVRPGIERVAIWNRTAARAEAVAGRLADLKRPVAVASDLAGAVAEADIVTCAVMCAKPVLEGRWLKPGAHVDLVGAYRLDMREADDEVMRRGRIFVNYRGSTIGHIGEIETPLKAGIIRKEDILADLYDLVGGTPGRRANDEITVYKNGGGAHLDLMTALAIVEGVKAEGAVHR